MTEALDEEVSYEQRAIDDVADRRGTFYTPSILQAATTALTDVLATP